MNYRTALAAALGLCALTSPAVAEPFCADMLNAETLERRYQPMAPIYNSVETGWIFGSDQLDYRYVLKSAEQALLADIVQELDARGSKLAMLIAPPRPVVAGQEVVDRTTEQPGAFDIAAQADAFHQMIEQIAEAGAIAPDLLDLALSDPALTEAFYFKRDTHWTNYGAAYSAAAMGAALTAGEEGAAFVPGSLEALELVPERGSLSAIVAATCNTTPTPEASPLFDYSALLPDVGGLLADTSGLNAPVVLVGTSFSDRYKRDQYQTREALSAAIGELVENRSVSGGGMVGPFETYLMSGAHAEAPPELIIWEFPYTYQLNEPVLRQLLGAIRADTSLAASARIEIGAGATDIGFSRSGTPAPSYLGLRMTDGTARNILVEITLENGSQKRLNLRRKSRMDEIAILDTWWIDLGHYSKAIDTITVEPRGESDLSVVELLTPSSAS